MLWGVIGVFFLFIGFLHVYNMILNTMKHSTTEKLSSTTWRPCPHYPLQNLSGKPFFVDGVFIEELLEVRVDVYWMELGAPVIPKQLGIYFKHSHMSSLGIFLYSYKISHVVTLDIRM